MKNFLFLVLLFQSLFLSAEDKLIKISESHSFYLNQTTNTAESLEDVSALKNEPFLAISLGYNCWPAAHLQDHALRKRSFPFDWMITSFETIYSLLETDFYGFLDTRYINLLNGTMPQSTLHGAQFAHDFNLQNWKQVDNSLVPINEEAKKEYSDMLYRYERRIARFYKVFELGIPVYLFRWNITKAQAYQLYHLLTKKFPKSDIHLICLQNNGTGIDENWGHPKIRHFSIGWDGKPLDPVANRSRNPEWTRIFVSLGLLRYTWNTSD